MDDNIKLGDAAFGNMLFVLSQPVTKKNHRDYKMDDGNELIEISDGIWAMPAYMVEDDEFSLFFIITKTDNDDSVMVFATGENANGTFNLSAPLITGEGLNLLFAHNEDRAKEVLHFINQISKADGGNWRMVENS